MAIIMNSALFKSVVEPILNKPFDGIYELRQDEWKRFMKSMKAPYDRAYYEVPFMTGFGQAPELPEGEPFSYDMGQVFYIARVFYKVYGLAFAMSQELIDDGDHVSVGTSFSKHLAQALIETKEWNGANMLNRAFNSSYPGDDGVSLVNTAHPLAAGGTFSNQLTTAAALSQTSLEQLVVQMSNAVNPNGKKIMLTPDTLVVHPNNALQAEVLLNTPLRTGTNNNDKNPLHGKFKNGYASVARFTSTSQFFITAREIEEGLQYVERRAVQKGMEGDFETRSMRYKADERYGMFWVDPRHVWGTPGV